MIARYACGEAGDRPRTERDHRKSEALSYEYHHGQEVITQAL
jgi:hypothetical protein